MKEATQTLEQVRGEIQRVFYSSDRWSAGKLKTPDGKYIAFAGNIVASVGQAVVLHGHYEQDPKWGRQLKVSHMTLDMDLDATGLANYLANSPHFKGIGPARARAIAEQFGSSFESKLLNNPSAIADTAKISIGIIDNLRREWVDKRNVNKIMVELSAYELTYKQCEKLANKYGNNAVGIVMADPYVIIGEIDGFGFKRVDKIARDTGVAKNNPGRIRAGLVYCVEEALDKGDCWVEYDDLLAEANKLLVMDDLDSAEKIDAQLKSLIDSQQLTCHPADSRFLVADPAIVRMEKYLARIFAASCDKRNPHFDATHDWPLEDIQAIAPGLNPQQAAAAINAAAYSVSLIAGGAGTGKTYTISAIVEYFGRRGQKVTLCAPTGKAAKRMEQVMKAPAMTIHRLLGYNGKTYSRGADDPIVTDILIVDEVSMVDVPLAWRLFAAVDLTRTAVVLVGDHNQLPPIGPGNILRDLIRSKTVPTIILDTVIRQTGVLKENCNAVLRGEIRKVSGEEANGRHAWYIADQFSTPFNAQNFILNLFGTQLTEKLNFNILRDVQLLTPTHKGPLGAAELNAKLQCLIQRKLWRNEIAPVAPGARPKFYANDKVINTRNNYEVGIMNGAIGFVREAHPDGSLVIEFEDGAVKIDSGSPHRNDIQLAYALTIHKAQGSEFPCSIVVVHKSHSFMHHRNLLYTGVTRAQTTAIIVGDHWGIANCVQNLQVDGRKTFLSLLLPEARGEKNDS